MKIIVEPDNDESCDNLNAHLKPRERFCSETKLAVFFKTSEESLVHLFNAVVTIFYNPVTL